MLAQLWQGRLVLKVTTIIDAKEQNRAYVANAEAIQGDGDLVKVLNSRRIIDLNGKLAQANAGSRTPPALDQTEIAVPPACRT